MSKSEGRMLAGAVSFGNLGLGVTTLMTKLADAKVKSDFKKKGITDYNRESIVLPSDFLNRVKDEHKVASTIGEVVGLFHLNALQAMTILFSKQNV